MSNPTSLMGPKAIALVAGAVVATFVALVIIANTSDNPTVSSLVPDALKRKTETGSAPVESPFSGSDNRVLFAKRGDTEIYKEERDGQWFVIIDGQESALYDNVANPTFSTDGSQFAYSAKIGDEEFVVMDNQQQGKSYLKIKQILFNADGSILAYLAESANGSLVVVDGKEGTLYGDIGTINTESGSTYLAFTSDSQIVYRAIDGQETFIVIDDEEGKRYAEISTIYFSSDGTQVAYYAQDGNQLLTIINGQVVKTETISPATTPANTTIPTIPTTAEKIRLNAKDPSRNLSPDIDNQPDKLNPLICGQTTDCNF